MSFVAFGIVTKIYIWPRLRMAQRSEALIALAVPHAFRFIGLSFLIPGVVSPSLPSDFSFPAAYGDLFAAGKAVFAEAPSSTRSRVDSFWRLGSVESDFAVVLGFITKKCLH